jgi:hypothetical protein
MEYHSMKLRDFEYIILLFFELIFIGYAVQAVHIQDTTRFYVVLVSMAILLLPIVFERWFLIRFPFGIKSVIGLALLLHMAGGINRYYWKYMPYYDKLAHVVSAIALGLLIFAFFLVLDYWEIHIRPPRILLGIFVLVLLFGFGWEIGEYYIDVLVQSSYNNGVVDSILDSISNIIGALIALLIARHYMKNIPAGKTPGYLLQNGT